MTVTPSNLFSNSWQTIYDLLDANVTNPHTTGKWIYGAFPEKAITEESYYPIIVVDKSSFQSSDVRVLNQNIRLMQIGCEISVYATNSAQLDTISDEVVSDLLNNLSSIPFNFDYATSSGEFETANGKRVHYRVIRTSFEYMVEIS